MEPMMISLKVLSTVAVMALVLPMAAAPTISFAQGWGSGVGGGGGGGVGGGFQRGAVSGPRYSGGGGYYRHHRHGGGFFPGAVAGALVGGAIASQSYGYYDSPGYYDDGYVDDGVVAVAPGGGDDAYCSQRYRSYDPASGTYLGYDGQRHPCP
jgi:hypothetical protein